MIKELSLQSRVTHFKIWLKAMKFIISNIYVDFNSNGNAFFKLKSVVNRFDSVVRRSNI